jgi:hypothetical protein
MGHATPRHGAWASALLLCAGLGLTAPSPANAEKVGVAAAVNPDAFSSLSGTPNQQLNIGKSIFYNERIKTTTSGLVQVLLVDGSTFTVGPNSNLVIDKFVYDPRKKTGEMVATFSKGTMRFIGGKLSKNAGGVKVKTPDGALAIRGGMFQGSTARRVYSFLYGHSLTFTGRNGQNKVIFASGNSFDFRGGSANIRPTTPEDIKSVVAALTSNGGSAVASGTGETSGTSGSQQQTLAETLSLQQLIADATATAIDDTIRSQEINQPIETTPNGDQPTETTSTGSTPTPGGESPPPPGGESPPPTDNPNLSILHGCTGGVYTQTGGDPNDARAGTLTSFAPNDFNLVFDKESKAFQGAATALFRDLVDPTLANSPNELGGATFLFSAIETSKKFVQTDQSGDYNVEDSALPSLFAGAADSDAISVFGRTVNGDGRPQLDEVAQLNAGDAVLVGFTGAGDALCEECDFINWGFWVTGEPLSFKSGDDPVSTADALGWWVAGDIVKDVAGALPDIGMAYYSGTALGEVWNTLPKHEGPARYTATGDMSMGWDFAKRSGDFKVTDFDKKNVSGYLPSGIDFGGELSAPGVPTGKPNQFGGPLSITRAATGRTDLIGTPGYALGSFVGATRAGAIAGNPKGVIGNWNIGGTNYKAGGIFGGSLKPQ